MGTGVGGWILKKDVLAHIANTTSTTNQDRSVNSASSVSDQGSARISDILSDSSIGNQRIQNPLLSYHTWSSSNRKLSKKEAGSKKKEGAEPVSDQGSAAGISAILDDSLNGNQRIQNPLLSYQTQSSSKRKQRHEKEPGSKKKEEFKPGPSKRPRAQKRKVDDDEDIEEEEVTKEKEEKADEGKGRIKCDYCNKSFNCLSSKFNHTAMSHKRHEDAFKKKQLNIHL